MILLADGGSTKCDWVLLDKKGNIVCRPKTAGLNPAVLDVAELKNRLQANSELQANKMKIDEVSFFGAGCGTPKPVERFTKVLQDFFVNAKIEVNEDTVAAVYAVTQSPGIVCILGTGSNSCLFDGEKIHAPIPSLGYSVMDEASGNYFGKQLLRNFFYKKMPPSIALQFSEKFNVSADDIKYNLYQQPNPNAYLASFAEFMFICKDENNYITLLLKKGMEDFIEHRVCTFEPKEKLPVHFVGSIAFFAKSIIASCLKDRQLEVGNFIQKPIDGLISYYRKHKLNT